MTDPGSVITLENVSRRFGETIALNNVSLILNEGEFFALLGPSGCGKTTLLRMIAGFEHPDRGRVLLDGQDITRLRPNRRPVNMMFQSYALFPHMSVAANIAYGLEMEKIDKNTINGRVDQIIETTKLSVIANRKPDQLSGGQRQRVALARALIKEPRVLLLDEPLAALDRKLRAQMQLELKRLQHELGITFIVVTHDQEEALGMADRIAVMNSGVIEQIGTPQSLYNEPANTFVADFIGVSNFLEGIYTSGKFVTETHGSFTLSEHTPLPERTDATMVIRPEALLLTQDQSLPDYHAIKGKIIDTIYGGKYTNVIVAVDGVTKGFTAQLESHTPTVSLAPDTTIWCNWKPSSAHLLQTAT